MDDYGYEYEWQGEAQWALDNCTAGILSSSEIGFLEDITSNWEGELTESQSDWLEVIVDKVGAYVKSKEDAKRLNR
jgi:hypothetical protein